MRQDRSRFAEWVRKWRIGPGMNDNERTRGFLQELSTTDGKFLKRFNEGSGQSLGLMDERLYSGFDGTVGDGWLPILDRLAGDLVLMGWDRDLHQVKEKFGTLRFYIGAGTEEMEARIDQAEDESARTCERCGEPGELRRGGWQKTLCDRCDGEEDR